jgi:hypothetical protein
MKRQIATALALGLFAVTLAASAADAQTGRHRVGPSAAAARAQAPHAYRLKGRHHAGLFVMIVTGARRR